MTRERSDEMRGKGRERPGPGRGGGRERGWEGEGGKLQVNSKLNISIEAPHRFKRQGASSKSTIKAQGRITSSRGWGRGGLGQHGAA